MALLSWRPLIDLLRNSKGYLATLLTNPLAGAGGGTGLVANSLTLKQVVLGYWLPVADIRLDLTYRGHTGQ